MNIDTTIPPIQHVSVSGSAKERGFRVGKLTRDKIHHSLGTYHRLFALCDISWSQAIEKSQGYLDTIKDLQPSYIEELQAMATGAGVEFNSLLALNCRTEILPSNFLSRVMANSDVSSTLKDTCENISSINECTSLAVSGATNNKWLAQNWDWCGLQRQALCVIESHNTDGSSNITVTEAGMLAKIGINNHGFAITLNILRSDKDGIAEGVPVHFLLRALLDIKDVEQAIDRVSKLEFSSSSNVMVQDAKGHIASFELSPHAVKILKPDNNCLCHTNHFLHDSLHPHDVGRPGNDSTINRLNRVRQGVHAQMSKNDIVDILCDQSDGLESICRFADPQLPDIAQIETVTSVIMNTNMRTLCVSGAQPSLSEFKTYSL